MLTRELPNPYYAGLEVPVIRLQELASEERDLSLRICENIATLHFEHSRSSMPDLNFVLITRQEEQFVEILTAVNDGYNFQWVPDRKMYSKLKVFLYKLLR